MDSHSERVVQEALDALVAAGGRTSVIIAHRLSTIRDADCITVMSKGTVLERGPHANLLLNNKGLYSKLWSLQNSSSTTHNK